MPDGLILYSIVSCKLRKYNEKGGHWKLQVIISYKIVASYKIVGNGYPFVFKE